MNDRNAIIVWQANGKFGVMMVKRSFLALSILLSTAVYGQIDAVVPDTLLDKFYINWPIDAGKETYLIGDTVVAVYNVSEYRWSKRYNLMFQNFPKRKSKPVVVRATVTDVDTIGRHRANSVNGLKLDIYSIEKYVDTKILFMNEFETRGGCTLKVGDNRWRDEGDWKNVSGSYKIKKSTDNYEIGDTVYQEYHVKKCLPMEVLNIGTNKIYFLQAVVRQIDTTEAQRLMLEFNNISRLEFSARNAGIKPELVESIKYNNKSIRKGDKVWAKPYMWFAVGQGAMATDAKEVLSFVDAYRGCRGINFITYDCNGNKYSLHSSQDQ